MTNFDIELGPSFGKELSPNLAPDRPDGLNLPPFPISTTKDTKAKGRQGIRPLHSHRAQRSV